MKLLFVVGVEGSGHYMFRSLMQEVIAQPHFTIEGEWREVMAKYWNFYYRHQWEFSFFSKKDSAWVKRSWKRAFEQCGERGVTHIMEDMSFPYNHPRNTIRRPDLIDFVELLAGLADIKFLALYRNPVSATYSGLRRGFTKNVYEQAKIVEDNLTYINCQLSVIGRERFRVLPVDQFLLTPESYVERVAKWTEVDPKLLKQGVSNIRQPYLIQNIPRKTRRLLSAFFSPRREEMWSALKADENTV